MRVGVFGATGQVGAVMRSILLERRFPAETCAFSRAHDPPVGCSPSAGRCRGRRRRGGGLRRDRHRVVLLRGHHLARAGPRVAAAGAIVIDNSSAWRMDPDVPLVVPEVNAAALCRHTEGDRGQPELHHHGRHARPQAARTTRAGLTRIVASTYQAVSGGGLAGTSELDEQVRKVADGAAALAHDGDAVELPAAVKFPAPIAFNVIPLAGQHRRRRDRRDQRGAEVPQREPQDPRSPRPGGRVHLRPGAGVHRARLAVDSRVRAAAVSVEEAIARLAGAPGVELCDIPTPLGAAGGDVSLVGRIRRDADGAPRAVAVRRRRQPPQGCRPQRRADRRGARRDRLRLRRQDPAWSPFDGPGGSPGSHAEEGEDLRR